MKNLLIPILLSLGINFSNAQECPTNLSCDTKAHICGNETYRIHCDQCPDIDEDSDLWFEVQIETANTTMDITYNNNLLDGYTLYGPIPSSVGCGASALNPFVNQADSNIAANYTIVFPSVGKYVFKVSSSLCENRLRNLIISFEDPPYCEVENRDKTCENCVGSFAPIPGKKYLISAWASEEVIYPNKTSFDFPEIYVHFDLQGGGTQAFGPFITSGEIIDGWQRIEEEFEVPITAVNIRIEMLSTSGDVYFDDIRVFPFDASMKTFVYDPINMRLDAELDERHYATFYEYDEEGKLVRIKKETEKGILTIQETKSNASK